MLAPNRTLGSVGADRDQAEHRVQIEPRQSAEVVVNAKIELGDAGQNPSSSDFSAAGPQSMAEVCTTSGTSRGSRAVLLTDLPF